MNEPSPAQAWLEQAEGGRLPVLGDCSVGRSSGNEVQLNHARVSRRHALIHVQGDGEYWLVDLGSSNGTYVNRTRVSRPKRLHDGDVIEISPFRMVFRHPALSALPVFDSGSGVTVMDQMPPSRKTCWLLVADIMGSTRLLQELGDDEFAVRTGRWFSACQQVLWQNAGEINKYLGDGFFAYWADSETALTGVTAAAMELRRLQESGQPAFRFVLHHGQVLAGGAAALNEESLAGREVTFVFRMEALAGELRQPRLLSETAAERLRGVLPVVEAGIHPLPDINGRHAFFAF